MIAALNLLIGFILIIKNKVFENLSTIACFLIIILMAFYVAEIVSFRWNQLTEKEKNKFTTFGEFKKNMSKIIEALKLGLGNFQNYFNFDKFSKNNENINKKKWVRNDKSDNIKP